MPQLLEKVAPLFQKYPSPISVATRMAQFVVESGAGQSPLYQKSFNGFGIKASHPWQGPKVQHTSLEADGKAQASYFRKYDSLEASIKDHASFFTSTPYRRDVAYKKAIEASTYQEEAQALTGIYAGDPNYGDKLIQIIELYQLTQYDRAQAPAPWQPQIIDRRDQALGGQAYDRPRSAIKTIVWHYTAVPRKYQRKIWDHEQYWKNQKGWDRGGYHYYIDSQGVLYRNYNLERITWGVADHNGDTVHISLEANSKTDYSPEQIKTRDWITRQLMAELAIPASQVKGHWEVNNTTACPGYNQEELEAFRAELSQPSKLIPAINKAPNKETPEKTSPKQDPTGDNYLIFQGRRYQLVPVE